MALEQIREYAFYSRPPRAMEETINVVGSPTPADQRSRFSVGIRGVEDLINALDERPLTLDELFQLVADYKLSIGVSSQESQNGKVEQVQVSSSSTST